MYFQSVGFLFIFLPIFLIALCLAPKGVGRSLVLLIFSLLFYSGAAPLYILILLASSLSDFGFALAMDRFEDRLRRRLFLTLSIAFNLGLLGFFKYRYMLLNGVAAVLPGWMEPVDRTFDLPPGISFYTFQAMSYVIDVYRRQLKPEKSLLGYLNYIAYLPQLIAGPIERFADLHPQIHSVVQKLDFSRWAQGVDRLALGVIQKILIADSCGMIVDRLASGAEQSLFSSWAVAIGFGMQIYFDFAAYTSMAIGISLLIGIQLNENFLSPYKARNIKEFWQRWHITLYSWFKDYFFVPIGGSQKGPLRTLINVMIVFSVSGLWHGASWSFVLWGFLHGMSLCVYLIYDRITGDRYRWPAFLSLPLTFAIVNFIWITFRFQDMGKIVDIWKAMVGLNGYVLNLNIADLIFLGMITFFTLLLPNASERRPGALGWYESAALLAIAFFAAIGAPESLQFIYFQF